MRNLYLIIRREFLERVARKSFIITTILMPILMLGLMMAPALIMLLSKPESKTIAVIDPSLIVSPNLENDNELKFIPISPDVSVDSVKRLSQYDAILVVGDNIVEDPNNVQMYTHSAPSMQTEQYITSKINKAVEAVRIKNYNIENLKDILADIDVHSQITTYRIDGSGDGEDKETSSTMSYLIGLVMSMMLYMFILIYGQMVMTSIIEEKNNRVLEIIVSSVKPQTLMLGKILGIGAVAVTQILIWALLVGCFSRWIMPTLTAGVETSDVDLAAALAMIGNWQHIMTLFGYILLFLIGGFLLYSSLYAAIGSAVDNIQDASQLSSIATVPIILGIVFSMTAATDPNSSLALWLSMIPFTSPMVMMARIPFGIPGWQIWVSLAILIVTFLILVVVCGKIYRVGIFMYGKKPTIKDVIRWSMYK